VMIGSNSGPKMLGGSVTIWTAYWGNRKCPYL
jgi:hypothetical protein